MASVIYNKSYALLFIAFAINLLLQSKSTSYHNILQLPHFIQHLKNLFLKNYKNKLFCVFFYYRILVIKILKCDSINNYLGL